MPAATGPDRSHQPVWQNSFFDRQPRKGDSYEQKWRYVAKNPVNHGLVTAPKDWLFQCQIHELLWHD